MLGLVISTDAPTVYSYLFQEEFGGRLVVSIECQTGRVRASIGGFIENFRSKYPLFNEPPLAKIGEASAMGSENHVQKV